MDNGFLLWVILMGAGVGWTLYRLGVLPFGKHIDGPIIAAAGMLNSTAITSLHKGLIGEYAYNILAASDGRVVVLVQLPRNTKLHIVAIGDKSIASYSDGLQLNHLTNLKLEGDFPTYFKMYCTPDKEQELLYLFDPADMAQFADFCRAYDFEIYHDSLYISQAAGARHDDDTTTLMKDIEDFITRNRRLLKRLGAEVT